MNASKGVILIVDDVPANLDVLMQFLENSGYHVRVATDGESAILQAEYSPPDIILLDVIMPGIDGFETCRRLKASFLTRHIPIIFMTALSETVDKVHGFEIGAADYITKPLQQEEVVARVNAHLTLLRQKQEIERLRQHDRVHYERLSRIKDDILSTASHDLKNPLAVITAAVSLLRTYLGEAADARVLEKLRDIELTVDQMYDMIVNLLDLARIETGMALHKQPVSLKHVLETSLANARPLADERHIRLQLRLLNGDITVECDPLHIGRVLQNLISNAIKYTPGNGQVEISVDLQQNQLWIQVSDTGIGIPETAIPHIFDKFYRVNTIEHMQAAGAGLGLSIVREIVQQHGGNIRVKSRMGAGTTFRFSLPYREQAAAV